jgi:uncharacterized protein with HEPN domain
MSRDDALLLDMLLAARKAVRFTQGADWTKFEADELIQNAVMHVIQVVGEAATKVSDTFKTAHPEIPWKAISGMRHRLVHDYTRIDVPTVWRVVQTHLPPLIVQLETLVPPEPPKTST